MISFKWMKYLIHFCWLEIHSCPNHVSSRERIKKVRKIENLKYIHTNELDKACFLHDAAYADNKDLARKTISEKTLKEIYILRSVNKCGA